MRKFSYPDGTEYEIDEHGVVHQLNPKPFTYDAQYTAVYDTPEYRKKSELLQGLRMGFVIGAFGRMPNSILDNGYGNGAFMEFAKYTGVNYVYGCDVTGVEVEGCEIVKEPVDAEVYTFHDCLEHIRDLSFVRWLKCDMVVISLPQFPGTALFENWKHRKPDEHLHHFSLKSLQQFMVSVGWKCISHGTHEDVVRQPPPGIKTNIITAAFIRGIVSE